MRTFFWIQLLDVRSRRGLWESQAQPLILDVYFLKKVSVELASFSQAHRYLELTSGQEMDTLRYRVAFTYYCKKLTKAK